MMNKQSNIRRGVTLVELLVCTCIVAVLVGMMVPAVQMARQAALGIVEANDEYQETIAKNLEATEATTSAVEGVVEPTAPQTMRSEVKWYWNTYYQRWMPIGDF